MAYSQFGQDDYALMFFSAKRNGYFVDVGACVPRYLSNTYLLESGYGWDGLLIEGNTEHCAQLEADRSSRCVNSYVSVAGGPQELTVVDGVFDSLFFTDRSEIKKTVQTRPLIDILDENNAPRDVDFLSLDVEGIEGEIIENFDFSKYIFRLITVEANLRGEKIEKVLTKNGYRFMQWLGEDMLFSYQG